MKTRLDDIKDSELRERLTLGGMARELAAQDSDTTYRDADGDCPSATCSAAFEVGGGWGNAINWSGTEQFDKYPLAPESRFNCHGWKWTKPKVGQTLKAEFVRSWMIFEFVEVKTCGDPPDMFFAVVKPIRQIPKQNK